MNTEHTAGLSDNEHPSIKDISQDGILHVYLNEYRKLKDEQITRIVMREHLVYVTLGVFGGVSSYALHEGQHYAFLVIPWVCLILGWMYLMTDEKVSALGKYIRLELSTKLEQLTGADTHSLLGWEVAHRDDELRLIRKFSQLIMDEITFVISGVIALIAFWQMQPTFSLLFQIIWGSELGLLLALGIWIIVTADLKKGR